jgi:adhesin transport system outer membrane protein
LLNSKRILADLSAAVALSFVFCVDANAMSLHQAIEKTIKTNQQILQAARDREAIEFELRQACGLYLPSVDLELGVGNCLVPVPVLWTPIMITCRRAMLE